MQHIIDKNTINHSDGWHPSMTAMPSPMDDPWMPSMDDIHEWHDFSSEILRITKWLRRYSMESSRWFGWFRLSDYFWTKQVGFFEIHEFAGQQFVRKSDCICWTRNDSIAIDKTLLGSYSGNKSVNCLRLSRPQNRGWEFQTNRNRFI